MKKLLSLMTALVLALTLAAGGAAAEAAEKTAVREIATAEELIAVNNDLAGSYVLTADIDLSGYENFPMIGTYMMDEKSEEGEDPVAEYAFTGSFDGNGHTISNLTIDATEDGAHFFGVGLFPCVGEGGTVKNLTVKDIRVKGNMLVGGVVGYAFRCTLDNVNLTAADRNSVESTMVMAGGLLRLRELQRGKHRHYSRARRQLRHFRRRLLQARAGELHGPEFHAHRCAGRGPGFRYDGRRLDRWPVRLRQPG